MKRNFLLSIVCLFCIFSAQAQTSLSTAADFTVRDTDGIEKLSVYPNPAINNLVIESHSNDKLNHIKVYDVLGNVLVNEPLDREKRYELDVSLYEKGVYFAEIATENSTTIKKFNKQ